MAPKFRLHVCIRPLNLWYILPRLRQDTCFSNSNPIKQTSKIWLKDELFYFLFYVMIMQRRFLLRLWQSLVYRYFRQNRPCHSFCRNRNDSITSITNLLLYNSRHWVFNFGTSRSVKYLSISSICPSLHFSRTVTFSKLKEVVLRATLERQENK